MLLSCKLSLLESKCKICFDGYQNICSQIRIRVQDLYQVFHSLFKVFLLVLLSLLSKALLPNVNRLLLFLPFRRNLSFSDHLQAGFHLFRRLLVSFRLCLLFCQLFINGYLRQIRLFSLSCSLEVVRVIWAFKVLLVALLLLIQK